MCWMRSVLQMLYFRPRVLQAPGVSLIISLIIWRTSPFHYTFTTHIPFPYLAWPCPTPPSPRGSWQESFVVASHAGQPQHLRLQQQGGRYYHPQHLRSWCWPSLESMTPVRMSCCPQAVPRRPSSTHTGATRCLVPGPPRLLDQQCSDPHTSSPPLEDTPRSRCHAFLQTKDL
jgi:hypothetical protein